MSAAAESASPWRCPTCDGDGFLLNEAGEASPCECRARQIGRSRSSGVSSVIPKRYRGVSFDRAPVPDLMRVSPDVVREVRRFVGDVDNNLRNGKGMWFTGDVGTGKSTLSMLVSKAALDRGHSVAIYSVPHLLAEIRDTYDTDSGERSYMDFFRRLASVDLLHLEDLGAEKRTDWVLEQLYSLVNQRYEDERSIVATTNLRYDQLEEQVGIRTASRLLQICGELWPLYGSDQRLNYDEPRAALG